VKANGYLQEGNENGDAKFKKPERKIELRRYISRWKKIIKIDYKVIRINS
jgi:hypothetical protein